VSIRLNIGILAPLNDPHALAVSSFLHRDFDADVVVIDVADFPSSHRIDLQVGYGAWLCHTGIGSEQIRTDLRSLQAIWVRRQAQPVISERVTDLKVRDYCRRESEVFFKGILSSLSIPLVNDPEYERKGSRKPFQLSVALECGLIIPKTLMSNNPNEVRQFCREIGCPSIYKPFTAPSWCIAETRVMSPDDLEHLESLDCAPIIVQEKIELLKDVRVNIFGENVFAAEVTRRRPEADVDWRMDLTATWAHHTLPENICSRLRRVLAVLGLDYGCIDLRQRPDGEYVFFEVNPSGQFLFIEVDTGQQLSHAMARLLIDRASRSLMSSRPKS
jgi:glutathione synthase/RimK-type ligase-like ATP-grasp enzyme